MTGLRWFSSYGRVVEKAAWQAQKKTLRDYNFVHIQKVICAYEGD